MPIPAIYTPELGAEICMRLAAGETLRAICRDESMPCRTTVRKWLLTDEHFASQYALARDLGLEEMADQLLDISDDGTNDWMEKLDKETGQPVGWQLNGEHVQRSKLRSDNRKWYLSKLAPKRYGERTQIASTDTDGNDKPALTEEQAVDRAATLLALARQRAAAGADLA